MTKVTASDVAQKLMLVFYRFGIPDTILSDQGTNYQSELLSELYELLDVHKVRTSPYHPQCDGITERFNRTLQSMLVHYVDENQQNWCSLLPSLAFAYNSAVHASTKSTSFELHYGRKPKVPLDIIFSEIDLDLNLNPNSYASEVKKTLNSAFDLVINNRDLAMSRNKVRHDREVRAANFELHDLVWVLDTAQKVGKSGKLSRKWKGPYRILSKPSTNTYEIQPVKKRGRKLVMNQCRLMKCFTRMVENILNPIEPDSVEKTRKKKSVVVPSNDVLENPQSPEVITRT